MQRGHNREPCFFGEEDYSSYLHWLGEALAEFECALHAYVLMTNHVHLLFTPRKAEAVPKLIISLGRRYVQYVNRSYRRTCTPAGVGPVKAGDQIVAEVEGIGSLIVGVRDV